jgi:uncharacterized protein YcbK (DUF882 family)
MVLKAGSAGGQDRFVSTAGLMISPVRRRFLQSGLAAAAFAAPMISKAAAPAPAMSIRRVALHNIHTNEAVDAVYWERGAYVPDALGHVSHVLRDFRTGDVHPIDKRLLDLLDTLSAKVETRRPFNVISGYRSPKTNAMLHETTPGVANNSLHMKGMAIDIRLDDVDLANLHKAAMTLKGGGVGYYPSSDFVHVDVGPVRHWG